MSHLLQAIKSFFLILFIGGMGWAVLIACSDGKPDFAAANAAKEYYDQLINEKYAKFVAGMDMPETIPESYRHQLEDNARMFLDEQRKAHQGIREIRVVNCVNDSIQPEAHAFLMLCYDDNTIEEVVVPMIKRKGRWYMK